MEQKDIDELAAMVVERLHRKGNGYYCWACGVNFNPPKENYHELCQTYRCPSCGSCFCSLTPETQKALDRAMASYGLWDPFGNPCRRK